MRKSTTLIAFVLLLIACVAQADTQLVYAGADGEHVVSIRAGEIRIDDTGSAWQLYRRQSNAIYAINPQQQSYTRMDESVAAVLQQQMQALREKIENRIRQLPPQQRDIARAALAEQIPGFASGKQHIKLSHTGQADQVAGVDCAIVQVIRNGSAAERMCVATPTALGLTETEFGTVRAMFSLMHAMLAGTGFEAVGLPYFNLKGMPVRFQARAGKQRRTLVRVSHKPLADQLFEIPPDFSEKSFEHLQPEP